jgi:enterochelin esterase-like enzyme
MDRRSFLRIGAAIGSLGLPARAEAEPAPSQALLAHDLILDGDRKLARRCLLLVPRGSRPKARFPLLILCHGLGEMGSELSGIHAWSRLYGLADAYDRLSAPPLQRAPREAKYLTDERMDELNRELAAQPLRGLAIACPYTPNPYKLTPTHVTLDRYAAWLEDSLIPAVRDKVELAGGPENTAVSGVSLGGYVALEVFARKPGLFGAFGCVQGAFGVAPAGAYAERLARAVSGTGPRRAYVLTSTGDPYRRANEQLARKLADRGVDSTLRVTPGPHNQPWLRESGSLELLVWHDRALGPRAPGMGGRSASP